MPPSISPIDDEMLVAGYSFHVRNVCIAEHALVSWTVETRTFPEVGVRVGAVYGRGALKVKGWALTGIHAANNLTYWGELHSLGLKDGFAEDPGDFTMTLEIEFPSDLEFESLDTRGVMHADYHRPRSE